MTKNSKMSNESVECPLCMEPMDFDDVDFFPCPCRYQICRFCWDKIINEENGLCPACRKPYNSEHPASYKPRTEEEIKNKIKHLKKVCTKKVKPTPEGKEYLTEYRVLQKNLIFVVGLPMRMAEEVELLKGSEYFGKCGKVYKIVINQNQTFPGPQGTPCLSAYVTYHRNEDALKTLVDLKKLEIDGRAVKLSLGTTKYCSQFLRNRRCTKQDCMYLHEMGDPLASFTKDDMSNGKHTEHENQLIQEFFDSQKTTVLQPNGTFVSTNSTDPEKLTQRKSSLTSQTTTSASYTPSSIVSASSTFIKGQRTEFTPIGTDLNDASKIYSISSDNCHSKSTVIKLSPDQCSNNDNPPLGQELLDNGDVMRTQCDFVSTTPTLSDLPCIHQQSPPETSNSLLDNFYYLNSQVSNNISNNISQYDQNINQQINNNNSMSNYSQIPFKNDINFSRSFESDRGDNTEQIFKDTADIDFDPIDISRLALAELVATEHRQQMTPYLSQMYAAPQRSMMRPSGHEYMVQSGDLFYGNNGNNPSHRALNQTFIHEKHSSLNGRISQQMSSGINNNNTSTTAVPLSSGFPSPPPGFEVTHNGCIGDPPTSDMMNLIMSGHNNAEMYNRYHNQHSSSDIPMSMNHHNNHYSNQYSIPPANSYHNEFSNFTNGGGSGPPMMGYNDLNSQSHPWKNAQSVFCDGGGMSQEISHGNLRSSATVAGYNRSHSMNENTGIRNSEWNGFASFNSTNDSHMNSFHEGNNFSLSMRGPSGVSPSVTTSNNDGQMFGYRAQTSHSVNH